MRGMGSRWILLVAICAAGVAGPAQAGQTVLYDVPSYLMHYGCGPTSLGMILGFWDAQGYDDLIPGSSDWWTNEQAIRDVIASPGHIRDYYYEDRAATPGDPLHADDSLADFTLCSRDPRPAGYSYYIDQDNGLENYAAYVGYPGWDAYNIYYNSLWGFFTNAIDGGKPAQFLVDTNADGSPDHFVTAVGYDDTPGNLRYACYDTYSHSLRWESFAQYAAGVTYGIYGGTFLDPANPPADGNGDWVVDDADYTLWADHYGDAAATRLSGDYNGDRIVDDADYTVWADSYGMAIGLYTGSTPAPPALAMLAVGAAAVLRRRR